MHDAIDAREVADYFLANVDESAGDCISNLKLQKLVYLAQGLCIGMRDEPLYREPVERWDNGPVVPSLYHAFKHRGNRAIEPPERFAAEFYAPEDREILDAVLTVYGQYSAWKLRDLTHCQPPWIKTARNDTITHDLLRDYFSQIVSAGEQGIALAGEPVWPTGSFRYQSRKHIMRKTPDRGRLQAAIARSLAQKAENSGSA